MSAPQRRYGPVDERVRRAAVDRVRQLSPAGMSRTAAAKVVAADIGRHFNTILLWVSADDGPPTGRSVPRLEAAVARLRRELASSQQLNQDLSDALHDSSGDRPQS
ncbi:hypothetical protein [Nocardia sp. NBC_01327]|uniref:hypothetical protein n=1 Tax=Nocardia sp. NBC_01327 TaxID=2903593 RepID=UPI002E135B1D|nr:hypothetical protein OG326_42525 [Nocardia sp. NBC_01327]